MLRPVVLANESIDTIFQVRRYPCIPCRQTYFCMHQPLNTCHRHRLLLRRADNDINASIGRFHFLARQDSFEARKRALLHEVRNLPSVSIVTLAADQPNFKRHPPQFSPKHSCCLQKLPLPFQCLDPPNDGKHRDLMPSLFVRPSIGNPIRKNANGNLRIVSRKHARCNWTHPENLKTTHLRGRIISRKLITKMGIDCGIRFSCFMKPPDYGKNPPHGACHLDILENIDDKYVILPDPFPLLVSKVRQRRARDELHAHRLDITCQIWMYRRSRERHIIASCLERLCRINGNYCAAIIIHGIRDNENAFFLSARCRPYWKGNRSRNLGCEIFLIKRNSRCRNTALQQLLTHFADARAHEDDAIIGNARKLSRQVNRSSINDAFFLGAIIQEADDFILP